MQILVPKCACSMFYNFSRIQSRTPLISSFYVAYFRSNPTSFEKWNNKWWNSPDFEDEKPSKTHIKYKTRQKRADAKKALNDIYFGSGSSNFTLEGEFLKNRRSTILDDDPAEYKNRRDPSSRRAKKWDDDPAEYKNRRGPSACREKSWDDNPSEYRNGRDRKKMKKSWRKANSFEKFDDDDYDDSGTHFQARFGNQRYSWSFKSWEKSFSHSQTAGFKYSNTRNKWRTVSDDDSTEDNDSYAVGTNSDRTTLGLPLNGPLNIEEVKNAFRLSALKWHPDKHQGPSQAIAEEKFKLCASAYKSLCNDLSRV